MCQQRSSVYASVIIDGAPKQIRVDRCIRHLPFILSIRGFNVVACCCGHGKYPLSIICRHSVEHKMVYYDLISKTDIPRSKKFYVRDANGYYFIPEVVKDFLLNQKNVKK